MPSQNIGLQITFNIWPAVSKTSIEDEYDVPIRNLPFPLKFQNLKQIGIFRLSRAVGLFVPKELFKEHSNTRVQESVTLNFSPFRMQNHRNDPAVPKAPIEGKYDATTEPPICPQVPLDRTEFAGQEDCLYFSVSKPDESVTLFFQFV
ncbi:unnamed protein product [Allacma fusca]|uniref:Uncharacterized protein n=1 Tax=Allacma fusca TaxID=39272 RepID=A0A8J2K7Z6_9HEXA|nr:unnamed protein product [Allacma fusca]